jgi:SIR2-like domain
MSAPFGLPQWDPFLRETAKSLGVSRAIDRLDKGEFELAAEAIDEESPELFTNRMRDAFDRELDPSKLREGAIGCLPVLTTGLVITTNFDNVVEKAFEVAGWRFEPVIHGPAGDPIVEAIHGNRHALLKIHGTVQDRRFRVFTRSEYVRSYKELEPLAWLIFTNRPLLFLGCSLETDRTVDVLKEIHNTLDSLRHYAILEARYGKAEQEKREKQLADWGIRPVWYAPGRFQRIAELLDELIERSGSREIRTGSGRLRAAASNSQRFRQVKVAKLPGDDLVKQIVGFVRAGEVAFSLGSGAHLGSAPLGDPFYDAMAQDFEIPLRGERSAVAAIVARRCGTAALRDWVRRELDKPIKPGPRPIHQMLFALPGLLRSLGQEAPMWVFTTNYDAALEQDLRKAEEPFHLLYYMEPEGCFAHVAPNGATRVIERPDAIRQLRPAASVVVKLNGGIVEGAPLDESFVIDVGQFERLAAQLPDVLPACVRTELEKRHLLFLGHGLNESDIRKVVEIAKPTKWTVQRPPGDPALAQDFGPFGLTVIARDLADFTAQFHAELSALR